MAQNPLDALRKAQFIGPNRLRGVPYPPVEWERPIENTEPRMPERVPYQSPLDALSRATGISANQPSFGGLSELGPDPGSPVNPPTRSLGPTGDWSQAAISELGTADVKFGPPSLPKFPGIPKFSSLFGSGKTSDLDSFASQGPEQSFPGVAPPSMFQNPNAGRDGDPAIVQGEEPPGPKMYMERTPGGTGMFGPEWALNNQGSSQAQDFRIPTAELYRLSFRPAEHVAPGANEWAQSLLKDRIGTEEFQRLLGQREQETIRQAQTSLHPDVQASQEAVARRATYPAQAQAGGMQQQALLNFLGRKATAEGQTAAREIEATGRHMAALVNAKQRLLSSLASNEVPEEDRSIILQHIEQIDKQTQALSALYDLGFTDDDLEAMMNESYSIDNIEAGEY